MHTLEKARLMAVTCCALHNIAVTRVKPLYSDLSNCAPSLLTQHSQKSQMLCCCCVFDKFCDVSADAAEDQTFTSDL